MITDRRTFTTGQRVTFRESETGPPESGTVHTVIDADDQYPDGGIYSIDLDDGTVVEAYWTELTAEAGAR